MPLTRFKEPQQIRLTRSRAYLIARSGVELIIDKACLNSVVGLYWGVSSYGYGITHVKDSLKRRGYRIVFLHNQVYPWLIPDGMELDHKNGNPLDNRIANLRLCPHKDNIRNSRTKRNQNKSSQFKGVSWSRVVRKWHAYIMVDGKRIHLGYFSVEADAARKYNQAARKHFGSFARVNSL